MKILLIFFLQLVTFFLMWFGKRRASIFMICMTLVAASFVVYSFMSDTLGVNL